MNAIDLTTLQAVKDFVEKTNTKEDAIISGLITSFSQWCLTYCGRDTLSQLLSFTEIYDGNGSDTLYLRNSPIQSLVAVLVNGNAMPISPAYGAAGAYKAQNKKSISIRQGSSGAFTTTWYPASYGPAFMFWKGKGNIQIQYTAGYPPVQVLNETITAQTITLAQSPWSADLGVAYYPSLVPLVLVANNPAVGQYSVSNGLYVFNVGDNTKQVGVSYDIVAPPADLQLVATRTVGTAYKRRQWLDQASKTLSAQGATGTTRYRDWKLEPIDQVTMQEYRRVAVV